MTTVENWMEPPYVPFLHASAHHSLNKRDLHTMTQSKTMRNCDGKSWPGCPPASLISLWLCLFHLVSLADQWCPSLHILKSPDMWQPPSPPSNNRRWQFLWLCGIWCISKTTAPVGAILLSSVPFSEHVTTLFAWFHAAFGELLSYEFFRFYICCHLASESAFAMWWDIVTTFWVCSSFSLSSFSHLAIHFLHGQWVLEESKHHGASERLGKTLRTKSTRTNTTSGAEWSQMLHCRST